MTDAELIELAAKAAAINAVKDPSGVWRDCTGMPPAFNILDVKPWNPLTNDGDALQLAVKLNMKINITFGYVEVQFEEDVHGSFVRSGIVDWSRKQAGKPVKPPEQRENIAAAFVSAGIDKNEATRLAIVRAAAEIGRVPMTEEQFDIAMRTYKLEREYADYILERHEKEIEQGMGLWKLMDKGDFLRGFKEKMTGIKNDQK